MLILANHQVTFNEIPDTVSLSLNIFKRILKESDFKFNNNENFPRELLTKELLHALITDNPEIECVIFIGGDHCPGSLNTLAYYIKSIFKLKFALFS